MSWQTEQGADFAVPDAILGLEGIDDLSWHNDTCPNFGRYWFDAELQAVVWCDHPDDDRREMPGRPRFMVTVYHHDDHATAIVKAAGLAGEAVDADQWNVIETDDADDAAFALAVAIILLNRTVTEAA